MRRCNWCDVVLRWWQPWRCNRCGEDYRLDVPGPWVTYRTRRDHRPDTFRFGGVSSTY